MLAVAALKHPFVSSQLLADPYVPLAASEMRFRRLVRIVIGSAATVILF